MMMERGVCVVSVGGISLAFGQFNTLCLLISEIPCVCTLSSYIEVITCNERNLPMEFLSFDFIQ
jgi:hypothetical protein